MRDYINRNISIDGRMIPYPVYTSWEYFKLHDKLRMWKNLQSLILRLMN